MFNEVAIDYNAGLTVTFAALMSFSKQLDQSGTT